MKSRWTIWVLLVAVVSVWGAIAWKLFSQTEETPALSLPGGGKSAETVYPVADTLRCDYTDPFLKIETVPDRDVRPSLRRHSGRDVPKGRREQVKIEHLGTVVSAGKALYILRIGDLQYEIQCGETAGEFILDRCDDDSLYLRKTGIRYGVKRCG